MYKSKLLIATLMTVSNILFAQNNFKSNKINLNAPVKCSKSVTINASSEKVWEVLTNIDNWSSWQTDISSPKLNGELKPQSTFKWKTGGAKINSTLQTVVPYSAFGWTGKTFGMFAIHHWTLSEVNGQILVEVDESMDGLLAKWFQKSFNKSLATGMQNWLDLLKEECEK